jgi:hypothetical protein
MTPPCYAYTSVVAVTCCCRYALPVFLAFSNPQDISPYFALLCIMINVIGAHWSWASCLADSDSASQGMAAEVLQSRLASRHCPQLWWRLVQGWCQSNRRRHGDNRALQLELAPQLSGRLAQVSRRALMDDTRG